MTQILSLFVATFISLFFYISIPAQTANSGKTILTADTGKITCSFQSPFSVNAKRVGGDLVVSIACSGNIESANSIPFFRKTDNGFVLSLPYSQKPTLKWLPDRLILHWSGDSPTGQNVFSLANPPVYPLGPGDELDINVYNVPDMKQVVTVDPKGFITFPVLDKIQVQGYTVNELQKRMEQLLSQFVKEPQVNIQLKEYGSRYVNVLGEVGRPGRIPLKGALRVLDAISQAGGFTPTSGTIEIRRKDPDGETKTLTLTQEDLLAGNGSQQSNVYLIDRDVVNVQGAKSVFINGEIERPGAYPYKSDLTLLQVITLAGGFSQWAKKDKIDILREKDGNTQVIHADATKIEKGKLPDIHMEPNDHIVVRERKFF